MVDEQIARLSPRQRTLLELRLRKRRTPSSDGGIAPLARTGEPFPPSFAQRRLWLLHQLDPTSSAYNIPLGLRLVGRLRPAALNRSLVRIGERHEALRTALETRDGEPVQVISPQGELSLRATDLAGLGAQRAAGELARIAAEASRLPFDLAHGPLLLSLWVRIAEDDHALLVTTHHVVSDGWSLGVFMRELAAGYSAEILGREPDLPRLAIQYADFSVWQRSWLDGEKKRVELDYWRGRLAGVSPLLALPTDRPRPPVQAQRGSRFRTRLGGGLQTAVAALAARAEATSFMVLLAAFQVLLGRYVGVEDVVIGTPIANRRLPELENLIGVFVNTLALRGDLSNCASFYELLARTREAALGAYSHQDLPFEMLVEDLAPERNRAHSPLVQVMFVLQNAPMPTFALPDVSLSAMEIDAGTSRFDLTLLVAPSGSGLLAWWEYDRDLFDRPKVLRIADHFANLLAAVLAEPEGPLSAAAFLAAHERQQVVTEWNDTGSAAETPALVHELIARQAERVPDAIAVRCTGAALSYRDLDERANRLARYLRRRGVGPESRVAIALERSLELCVAILGVLKAGGAYLPIDPTFPRERQLAMLEDGAARWIVSHETQAATVGEGTSCGLVCLDREGALIAAESARPPVVKMDLESLAYVLFTSGSTGRAKGVMVVHRGLSNYLEWCARAYPLAGGGAPVQSPVGFDLTVTTLFGPLLAGRTVDLLGDAPGAEALRLALAREHFGFVKVTPAHLELLEVEAGGLARGCGGLVVGGDALSGEMIRTWRENVPDLRIFNEYGPTEATVGCCVHAVAPGAVAPGPVPIGRPIFGAQIFLVDAVGQIAPSGVDGELLIGGAGLARGYSGNPAATAERFLPDPWSGRPGARLYASGDLARRLPAGHLIYIGRNDQQVKIRGFRIEPGEIETALRRHPEVNEAAVLAREDTQGGRDLVAYVVPRSSTPLSVEELRIWVRERLPEFMTPAFFVMLESMPLTANGKLDRKALPPPVPTAFERSDSEPRTPIERTLARIWSEILGLERVGIESSFFELGGHSLSAARLMHRVRLSFGVDLALGVLFDAPTISNLAAEIARRKADPTRSVAASELPLLVPDPMRRGEPFPLNDVQQAYWVGRSEAFELGNVASHSYTEVDLPELDVTSLNRALRRLIERHDMLRAVILPDGDQRILPRILDYRVKVIDLRGLADSAEEAVLLATRESLSHEVLPATRAPMFEIRVSLLGLGGVRLHSSVDALVTDAWSAGLMLQEVGAFYRDPSWRPAQLDLSFRDYVLGVKRLIGTPAHRAADRYWRDRLATLAPAPELPTVKGALQISLPRFVRRSSAVDPDSWSLLKARAARLGVTPSGLLLAVFGEVLGHWSRSPRFTLNLTLFNRLPLHPQVDSIVGDFTSLTLLEIDAMAGSSFAVRARAVQEQLWQDLEHRVVSGVEVMRMMSRAGIRSGGSMMPVVFTSTFGQGDALAAHDDEGAGRVVYSISQTPQVLIDHQVSERAGMLAINWDVVEDAFPAGLVDDLFGAMETFLKRLGEEVDWRRIGPAALSPAQLMERQDRCAAEVSTEEVCLHELFERRVAENPGATAILAPDRTLTYCELDGLANAVAASLLAAGVRPNRLVAVVMDKGWEQAVAVLGILKAGAAYLPIDSELPETRRNDLLARGEADLALTTDRLKRTLAWPSGITPIPIGPEMPDSVQPVSGKRSQPGDLAYVIFTSGSTGIPKGVMIDHRGAVNTILDILRRFDIGSRDRVLALSSLSFDLSVFDLFGLLAAGGAVVFPEVTARREPESWIALMKAQAVTLWNTVPALMEMLVQHLAERPTAVPELLRLVMLSGDWIPTYLPDRIRAYWPKAEVVSLGGATEASIWSIFYPIGDVDPEWPSIPYGRAMANQQVYVLGPHLEPRPTWVPGELYIAGVGLALGYWRDSERTGASFLEHPLTGERLYRTGDWGRYLPDRNIEFLGREDSQVKIQGYRIELGEIEATLERHPRVASAVVIATGASRTNRRLAAYLIPRTVGVGSNSGAERELARLLPSELADEPEGEMPQFRRDAVGLLEFKLREPGLRRGDRGHPAIVLPSAELDERPYKERASRRTFSDRPVEQRQLGLLLAVLSQLRLERFSLPKYRYPSAGHLYPVQTYVYLQPGRVENLGRGIYYWHPKRRCLVAFASGARIASEVYDAANASIFDSAAFSVYLIADLGAIAPIYGSEAWDFCLLEAGYMGQLLMTEAPAHGLGLCPIGSLDFEAIRPRFKLTENHTLAHSLLGGRMGPAANASSVRVEDDSSKRTWSIQAPTAPTVRGTHRRLDEFDLLEFKLAERGIRDDAEGDGLTLAQLEPGSENAWEERRSHREFLSEPIPADRFGRLLSALRQAEIEGYDLAKYRYPSAGHLYPVQTYLYVKPERVEGVPAGAYYYHPKHHRLIQLSRPPEDVIDRTVHGEVNRPVFDGSAFSIFLVAQLEAIEPVYGDLARPLCFLEAGYMGQLLMDVAPPCGLGLCPVSGLEIEPIARALRLGANHLLLHGFLGGSIPGAETQAAFVSGTIAAALREELRAYLGARLPAYMVPSSFTFLDAFPLSANGKVDRRALPAPEPPPSGAASAPRPDGDLESRLAAVWAEVFELKSVGRDENFLELGGDSILAVRLVARAAKAGLPFTIRQLFDHQSVGELAAVLVRDERPTENATEVQLTEYQRLLLDRLPARVVWRRSHGSLDRRRLLAALSRLTARHDSLRLRRALDSPAWTLTDKAAASVGEVDLRALAAERRVPAFADVARAFTAPLSGAVRCAIVRGAGGEDLCLVGANQMLVDGNSWPLFKSGLIAGEFAASNPAPSYWRWLAEASDRPEESENTEPDRAEPWPGFDESWGTVSILQTIMATLDSTATQDLLDRAAESYRAEVEELLLAALARALSGLTPRRVVDVDLLRDGRRFAGGSEPPETIGGYGVLTHWRLDLEPEEPAPLTLRRIKEGLRKPQPRQPRPGRSERREIRAGLLVDLSRISGRGCEMVEDGWETLAGEVGTHELEVGFAICASGLEVRSSFSAAGHAKLASELCERLVQELRDLIIRSGKEREQAATPADFPLLDLGNEQMKRILRKYGEVKR